MTSNQRLLYWYRKYNRLYWNNRLDNCPEVYYDNIAGHLTTHGDCYVDPFGHVRIRLAPVHGNFQNVQIDLLHEMVHAAIWSKHRQHGKIFYAEQDRIFRLGAFRGLL